MSTLKFEVGKAYRTFDGRKAVCLTTTLDGKFRIGLQVGGRLIEITGDGNYIASEWVDKPVIDWSLMPAWAKFVAMNEDGAWNWYRVEPNKGWYMWLMTGTENWGEIPSEYAPKWDGDWKNSLIERP
jgi:hypothetical protein